MTKYVFVTGGVVSSLGKGITAASLGRLLKARGLKVQVQKFDPYLNVDPGTMSPFQHGEVFVTEDGAETDLDIGHYERFVDENLSRAANHTAGAVWDRVLRKERKGEYLGSTVQVIPHITNEIKSRIRSVAEATDTDVVITEVGGTVGDIESQPFLEAIRQFRREVGPENVVYLHVTLVPYIDTAGELKTKPTQHSVNELRRIGIHPDVLVCRSTEPLARDIREKIALFADVDVDAVITNPDVADVYLVPLALQDQGLDELVCRKLGHRRAAGRARRMARADRAHRRAERVDRDRARRQVRAAARRVPLRPRGAEARRDRARLPRARAVGRRRAHDARRGPRRAGERRRRARARAASARAAGRARSSPAASRARTRSRTSASASACTSPSPSSRGTSAGSTGRTRPRWIPRRRIPVIDLLPEQKEVEDLGGTMRLGAQAVELGEGTRTREVYADEPVISERHRHRYEVNNAYRQQLSDGGLVVSGTFQEGRLVEIVELPDHPWFVASQFHPEFKSRPTRPGAALPRVRRRGARRALAPGRAPASVRHTPEAHRIAGRSCPASGRSSLCDDGDHRIAAGRRMVVQQQDRLPDRRHLRARR